MNLREAAALLGHAAAVIGVDTGLTHLANALDVPLVAIYTDTDPALTGVVEARACGQHRPCRRDPGGGRGAGAAGAGAR
jgi:ADP-heptose:LPS heptosyltransferase